MNVWIQKNEAKLDRDIFGMAKDTLSYYRIEDTNEHIYYS